MRSERIAAALQLLKEKGFAATSNRAGTRTFEGTVPAGASFYRVRVSIRDWDFLEYPKITLLSRPPGLPALLPNVNDTGELCYFSPGTVILDRYDAVDAILQCLEQATKILQLIAADPNYRASEIHREFLAYWKLGAESKQDQVFIDDIFASKLSANFYLLERPNSPTKGLIAANVNDADQVARAWNYKVRAGKEVRCWAFSVDQMPTIPDAGLPSTVKELFAWLIQWDKALHNAIQKVLERERSYLEHDFVPFAVNTPTGWIGFSFKLDQLKRLGAKNNPRLYKQHLHGKGGTARISRYTLIDISPSFIHSRNLTYPDLRDKTVVLVGCGAIGGYLAQSLVRLGAGSGKGRLVILDEDVLEPDNLGRHYLGFSTLFEAKASALRDQLRRDFPHANVEAVIENVADFAGLFKSDLIIDATGEEAVSDMLNEKRISHGAKACPVLFTWIKGNGDCVQALWFDDFKQGCFRCLKQNSGQNHRKDRFSVLKGDPVTRFVGCRAFTPYAVSAPMHAACLATDMVIDWLKKSPSPRFRTRATEGADVIKVKNQNITRLEGCPACDPQ